MDAPVNLSAPTRRFAVRGLGRAGLPGSARRTFSRTWTRGTSRACSARTAELLAQVPRASAGRDVAEERATRGGRGGEDANRAI